jgi:hypothetical protein
MLAKITIQLITRNEMKWNILGTTLEHHLAFLEAEQKKLEKASDDGSANIDDPIFKKALETYMT